MTTAATATAAGGQFCLSWFDPSGIGVTGVPVGRGGGRVGRDENGRYDDDGDSSLMLSSSSSSLSWLSSSSSFTSTSDEEEEGISGADHLPGPGRIGFGLDDGGEERSPLFELPRRRRRRLRIGEGSGGGDPYDRIRIERRTTIEEEEERQEEEEEGEEEGGTVVIGFRPAFTSGDLGPNLTTYWVRSGYRPPSFRRPWDGLPPPRQRRRRRR